MAGSYERINYSLRPAKAIERKMLCEGFARLYPFQRVSEYGYVGFGSPYFTDFALVHNLLGISDMESIEKEVENAPRFEFNRPYKCIRLKFDWSYAILPKLDWSRRLIIWLDYDDPLATYMLADVATIVAKARSGTMLVLSVNAHPEREPSEEFRRSFEAKTGKPFNPSEYRLSTLRDSLGEKVPRDVTGKQLREWDLAKVLRRIIINEIEAQLSVRNIALDESQKLHFEQIFNFHYQDGAYILTVGGVIYSQSEQAQFDSCQFKDLTFGKSSDEPYKISVPCLTIREMRHIDSQLPSADYSTLGSAGVPDEDVHKYADIYRYFPTYHEVLTA